jgi:hypothetical protein
MHYYLSPSDTTTKKILKELAVVANQLKHRGTKWNFVELTGIYDESLRLTGVDATLKVEREITLDEADEADEVISRIELFFNPTYQRLCQLAEESKQSDEEDMDWVRCDNDEDEDEDEYDEDEEIFYTNMAARRYDELEDAETLEKKHYEVDSKLANAFNQCIKCQYSEKMHGLFLQIPNEVKKETENFYRTVRLIYNDVRDLVLYYPGYSVRFITKDFVGEYEEY